LLKVALKLCQIALGQPLCWESCTTLCFPTQGKPLKPCSKKGKTLKHFSLRGFVAQIQHPYIVATRLPVAIIILP